MTWCNVWAHQRKKILLIPLTFHLPWRTSPHQPTCSSNVWPLFALCVVLFYYKRESTVVSSGARDVTLVTHIYSHSAAECFCMQPFVTRLGIVVYHHKPGCHAKKKGILSSRSRSQCGLIWWFLLYLLLVLNQWVFCNKTQLILSVDHHKQRSVQWMLDCCVQFQLMLVWVISYASLNHL